MPRASVCFSRRWGGRPVVVLSNNDGCVIARSNEARALGVEMDAPWHLHKAQFSRSGIIGIRNLIFGRRPDRVTIEAELPRMMVLLPAMRLPIPPSS